MCVEQAFGTQAVEGLARGHQVVTGDADAHMLLVPLDEGGGGHAGPVCLTHISRLLTVGAVTSQSCEEEMERGESGRAVTTHS